MYVLLELDLKTSAKLSNDSELSFPTHCMLCRCTKVNCVRTLLLSTTPHEQNQLIQTSYFYMWHLSFSAHLLTKTSRRWWWSPLVVSHALGLCCFCLGVEIDVVVGVAGVRDDNTERSVAVVRWFHCKAHCRDCRTANWIKHASGVSCLLSTELSYVQLIFGKPISIVPMSSSLPITKSRIEMGKT